MTRPPLSEIAIEDRFYECLRGTGRGLTYGRLVTAYALRVERTERTAKSHLKLLVEGMRAGRIKSVGRYRGPEGWLYGCAEDKSFVQAKEDAERPAPVVAPRDQSLAGLGGPFQDSPVNSEWTHCPETGRIVRATVITMGVADFMECPVCNRAHFLGVSPKLKDQRLYAWQVDPLVNAAEYADSITTLFMGDPKTLKRQPPSIERIRKGGRYVGLWFRNSWDYDPLERLSETSGIPVEKLFPDRVGKKKHSRTARTTRA
jgi:hypothetical protein